MKQTLTDLRRDRALTQAALGAQAVISKFERGARTPGPCSIARMAAVLGLAPIAVMDACRESRRRSVVARERSRRLVGKVHVADKGTRTRRLVRPAGP